MKHRQRLAKLVLVLSLAFATSLLFAGVALADWNAQSSTSLWALDSVSFADEAIGWAVGQNGTIVATGNGGLSWQQQDSVAFGELYSVAAVDTATAVAVGEYGMFLKTADNGMTWVRRSAGLTTDTLLSVDFAAGSQTGYAVSGAGHVYTSSDGGDSWSLLATAPGQLQGAWKVSFRDAQHGMIAGESGGSPAVFVTADGGATWMFTVMTMSGDHPYVESVATYDATHAIAVGSNGTIFESGDDGVTWTTSQTDDAYDLNDVQYADASTAVAVGLSPSSGPPGTILRIDADSVTWAAQSNPSLENLNGLAAVDAATVYAVDDMGGIVKYTDTAPPAVTSSADGDSAWHNSDVVVSLSPADTGGSGMQKTQYRLQGDPTWLDTTGNQFTVAAPADHSYDGSHVYEYIARDRASNVSSTNSVTVRIDTEDPGTSDDAPAGWKNTEQTVTLSPTDVGGSLVQKTQYRLQGDLTWLDATSDQFIVPAAPDHSEDGASTYEYITLDNAGNVSATGTCTVSIDTAAPGIPQSMGATYNAPGHNVRVNYTIPEAVTMAPLTITVTLTDRLGRTTRTPVVFDGDSSGTDVVHQVASTLIRGSYRIAIAAADQAGNTSEYPVSAAFSVR